MASFSDRFSLSHYPKTHSQLLQVGKARQAKPFPNGANEAF